MHIGILGCATTKFGELWDRSPRSLAQEVVRKALADSRLTKDEIDALYVGNMLSGILGGQENLGAFFAAELGMTCPAFKIEGACASGGLAVHNAALSIASGLYDKVLVLGVEKMTDYKPEETTAALMGAGSDEERKSGLTFPGLYALMARVHMQEHGTTEEELAAVSVKNHYHASLNGHAHFTFEITLEKVLKSPLIADPLKLLDCSPISDGAATVILAKKELAVKKHKKPIWIVASAVSTDTLSLHRRKSLTTLSAAVSAAKDAYSQADIKASDIDIAEVHDCFSIAEVIAMEDLGFFAKGRAARAILQGKTRLDTASKKHPVVNTSGGLKASGHPVGATGVKQIVEIVVQLRNDAGKRQVDNAKIGLTHNIGGSGAVAAIHILKI